MRNLVSDTHSLTLFLVFFFFVVEGHLRSLALTLNMYIYFYLPVILSVWLYMSLLQFMASVFAFMDSAPVMSICSLLGVCFSLQVLSSLWTFLKYPSKELVTALLGTASELGRCLYKIYKNKKSSIYIIFKRKVLYINYINEIKLCLEIWWKWKLCFKIAFYITFYLKCVCVCVFVCVYATACM